MFLTNLTSLKKERIEHFPNLALFFPDTPQITTPLHQPLHSLITAPISMTTRTTP